MNPSYSPQYQAAGTAASAPSNPNAPELYSVRDEVSAKEFLSTEKWPTSMQDMFLTHVKKIAFRFFICDDSGSMGSEDGKTIYNNNGKLMKIKCTRWKELSNALRFHAGLANAGGIPSEFRFLNSAQPLRIGFDPNEDSVTFPAVSAILNDGSPSGGTPLCRHITEITAIIRAHESYLRSTGKKACIIIATDGESSDGDVAKVLEPLKSLPVWVVLRFCTDDDNIVRYWNNIDNNLELDMDVLDDYFGEAQEVYESNNWLVYGEAIHRMREFGVTMKELDQLDEALLSVDDMMKVCKMCLGPVVDRFPHPAVDMAGFLKELNTANALVPKVWNPVTGKVGPWIDPHKISSNYKNKSNSGGCILL